MRHYSLKTTVVVAVLMLCAARGAWAQAPRGPQAPPNQPAMQPLSGGYHMVRPPAYVEPTIQQGPMGFSALDTVPSPSVAQEFLPQAQNPPRPTPPAAPAKAQPTQAPPAVNPLAAPPREEPKRLSLAQRFFSKAVDDGNKLAADRSAAQAAAQAKQGPARSAPLQAPPATGSPPQPLAAQRPIPQPGGQVPLAMPQGPVIICMPAGWEPPPQFAPRQISPEVKEEFWPVASGNRSPLSQVEPGGMFRWPHLAKDDEPQAKSVAPHEPARALVGGATRAAQPEVDTTPPWKKILMAKSHGDQPTPAAPAAAAASVAAAPGKPASKALFSLGGSKSASQVAVSAPAPAAPRPRVASVPAVQVPALEPPQAPSPPAVAAKPSTASRIATQVPAAPTRLVADSQNPKLQWRAKGAPPVDVAETGVGAADAVTQVVAHNEPVEPTPADPALDPANAGTGQLPEAPLAGPPVSRTRVAPPEAQPVYVPAPQAPPRRAPLKPGRQKSIIPQSFFDSKAPMHQEDGSGDVKLTNGPQRGARSLIPPTVLNGQPSNREPEFPAITFPSAPQPGGKALVRLVPMQGVAQPMDGGAVAAPSPNSRALAPNMFSKADPRQVGLRTKPAAVPRPVGGPVEPAAAPPVTLLVPAEQLAEAAGPELAPEDEVPMPAPPAPSPVQPKPAAPDTYYAPPRSTQADAQQPTVSPADGDDLSSPAPPRPQTRAEASRLRRAEERAIRQRGYAAPRRNRPIIDSLKALGEMTKLPKAVTDWANEETGLEFSTASGPRHEADMPRRAHDPHRAPFAADPTEDAPLEAAPLEPSRQAHEEVSEAQPTDEPASRPSKRRKQEPTVSAARSDADQDSGDAAADESARQPEEDGAQPKKRQPTAAKPDVKVASGQEGAPAVSRATAVRMQKKNGSSVIVYYPNGEPATDASDADAGPGAEPRSAGAATKAAKPRGRVNPLR